jgi:hypothetical protein
VDANGGYDRKPALAAAQRFADSGVTWFEEPVSSNDLEGLRLLRDRSPPGMEIAAGAYGFDLPYFRRMLDAGAVDVLMPDATRCAGITGFLKAGALCEAFDVLLSAYTAPSIHLHPCCAIRSVRHLEYFFDHVHIERMLFDGAREPVDGQLAPDPDSPPASDSPSSTRTRSGSGERVTVSVGGKALVLARGISTAEAILSRDGGTRRNPTALDHACAGMSKGDGQHPLRRPSPTTDDR